MSGERNPDTPDRQTSRPSRFPLRSLPGLFREASSEWIRDNAPRLGAAVAFYTLLSLAPLIVIAVAVAAAVYGKEAAQGRLAWEIQDIAGHDVARKVQELIRGAHEPRTGAIATSLGLVTLVFGASSVFVELRDAMNTIWHVAIPSRTHTAAVLHLIKDRFFSFAAVLGTGFLLLASLVLNAWVAAMGIAVPRAVTLLISYLVIALVFATLYKIVPDVRLRWRDVALGALIASVLFMVGKLVMGWYFAHASFGSTYGAAGSPIVVLLWVYYSAQLFFWGAEFSKVYAKAGGSRAN